MGARPVRWFGRFPSGLDRRRSARPRRPSESAEAIRTTDVASASTEFGPGVWGSDQNVRRRDRFRRVTGHASLGLQRRETARDRDVGGAFLVLDPLDIAREGRGGAERSARRQRVGDVESSSLAGGAQIRIGTAEDGCLNQQGCGEVERVVAAECFGLGEFGCLGDQLLGRFHDVEIGEQRVEFLSGAGVLLGGESSSTLRCCESGSGFDDDERYRGDGVG